MSRRYGDSPDPSRHYTQRPGAYAILPRGRQILVTCQAGPRPDFQLPGGGIDPGEQPLAALHREVLEETGWRIGPPRRIGIFRRFVFMPDYDLWAEKLCLIYLARPICRISAPTEQGHSAHWLSQDVAHQLLGNSGDRAMVAALRSGKTATLRPR